jgi:hypothetical protein
VILGVTCSGKDEKGSSLPSFEVLRAMAASAHSQRDIFRGDVTREVYDAGSGEVRAEELDGRLGGVESGFKVDESNADGAVFEERTRRC